MWAGLPGTMSSSLGEHYKRLASQYDEFYEAQSRAKANFTQRFIPLSKDDQLVDVGGGTAQFSLMIHSDLGMTNPVVCVDPCEEMLEVARKNGAITVHSTAEDFLSSSKPEFPLKVVLMMGCIHHFQDITFVFSKLVEHMPEDGICFVSEYPAKTSLPLFKAAKSAFAGSIQGMQTLAELAESKGLKCKMVSGVELVQTDKELWYHSIRNRLSSSLRKFSDTELEEELEREFKGKDMLIFDLAMEGLIISKT